jgi:hypothetical protein
MPQFVSHLSRPAPRLSSLLQSEGSSIAVTSSVSSKQFAALQAHRAMASGGSDEFPQSATTILTNMGSEYVGEIGIGTQSGHPQETLRVVYDTGSTNLWMASTLCTKGPCASSKRKRYDYKSSETYRSPMVERYLDISFGTANLKGPLGVDDFHIGPFTVKNQTFALIQEERGSTFASLALEGIVGLGFPALGSHYAHPFFESIIEQKVLKHNMFTFYMPPNSHKGAVLWGGYESSVIEGDMMWFPVTDAFYWAIDLHEFLIGEKKMDATSSLGTASLAQRTHTATWVEPQARLIIDTGTTYYAADGQLYRDIISEIGQSGCSLSGLPNLTYRLKDINGNYQDIKISPEKYIINSGFSCDVGFMQVGPSRSYGPAMMLGDLFMQEYVVVFDRGNGSDYDARIGFGKMKNQEDQVKDLDSQSQSSLAVRRHISRASSQIRHAKKDSSGESALEDAKQQLGTSSANAEVAAQHQRANDSTSVSEDLSDVELRKLNEQHHREDSSSVDLEVDWGGIIRMVKSNIA